MTEHALPAADYGLIGVGWLAEAIVTGLCEGRVGAPRIVPSPRSDERANRLAYRYHRSGRGVAAVHIGRRSRH
jgi:pyrroline-5-carboxylate reductase